MERTPEASAVLQRIGGGAIAGAVLCFALAAVLLAEIGALVVLFVGLAVYALEQQRDRISGLSAGFVLAAVLPILDRQLDPLGATLVRSTAATVAIGVGLVVGGFVVDRYGATLFDRGS